MIKKDSRVLSLITKAEQSLQEEFKEIDQIEMQNLEKVLNAFNECNLEERHFVGSSGYGHNDIGKDITNQIFAKIFNAESAYVSPLFTSGTSAISHVLLGLLRPNDTMLCISGTPYDTLKTVIFGNGKDNGSLKDFNILYEQIDLVNGSFDIPAIEAYLREKQPKIVYIQRSRGYDWRNALTLESIKEVCTVVKKISKAIVVVDNCYGEFVCTKEPTDVGADIIVGSMIKNIGGGIKARWTLRT